MKQVLPLKKAYFVTKKHRRMANKIALSLNDKLTIKNMFFSWLVGIEEDDPLPLEISCLCLCFEFNQKAVNISLSGFENEPEKIDKGSYAPLEAQYFFCELLNSFVNNPKNLNTSGFLFEKVKQEIFQMFNKFFHDFQTKKEFKFLSNKKIIIGEFLKEKAYSFRFVCE